MDWLGLGPDDAYDDYARPGAGRPPVAAAQRTSRPLAASADIRATTNPTVPFAPCRRGPATHRDADLTGRRPVPATDDSNVQPRPINTPRQAPVNSADPYTVRPRRFDAAQEVAESSKRASPSS